MERAVRSEAPCPALSGVSVALWPGTHPGSGPLGIGFLHFCRRRVEKSSIHVGEDPSICREKRTSCFPLHIPGGDGAGGHRNQVLQGKSASPSQKNVAASLLSRFLSRKEVPPTHIHKLRGGKQSGKNTCKGRFVTRPECKPETSSLVPLISRKEVSHSFIHLTNSREHL